MSNALERKLQGALACFRARDAGGAERLCKEILREAPGHPAALHLLGIALASQLKLDDAVTALSAAAALASGDADVHLNLGNAYAELRRTDEAAACYRKVMALQPNHALASFNLGTLYHRAGRLDEAVAAFKATLTLAPNDPDAHNNLGLVYGQQQRINDEMACYRRALELDPGHVHARVNLGNVLCALGKPGEGITHFRRALELDPRKVSTHRDLGAAYLQAGDLEAATGCLRRATEINPRDADACYSLAEAFKLAGRLDEAIAHYERALALRPDHLPALNGLVHVRQHACNWGGIERQWEQLRREIAAGGETGATPFSILSLPASAAEQRACAEAWARSKVAPLSASRPDLGFDFSGRRARDRLRIGYLSWGFHRHATSYWAAELLELHDRRRYEVFAYDYGPDDGSEIRARIRKGCDRFIEIADDSHLAAARRIYDDEVDILVDLTGYTLGARPQIIALRPAPVQVSWFYPGTMGTDCMDYFIADPFVVPPGSERFFAEKIMRLPDCYMITDRLRAVSERVPSREACGLPDEAFVFCCFNQAYKIVPEMFGAWMRILQAVPGSVLWLAEANRWQPENLRREAAARGVAGDRLVFVPRKPIAEYMVQYRIADFALDTYPYTSHTTAADALWMGCPLVTCAGETFASRVAGSVLINAGMREWVTGDLGAYERTVIDLARSPDRLRDIRNRLRENRESCPLFDTPRFVRNLEHAYEAMLDARRL